MRVQTSSNIDISRNSNGHISVVHDAAVTSLGKLLVQHVLYVDMTLTPSKVKVTEHLNFRQLPITAHF